jgi:response regulator RpfG family c-di-GMP phosphodiesterase
VVVTDLKMPEMDGIELLARVRDIAPDTVRIMLTGQADFGAAVDAVNEGNIFRFLTKPCADDTLATAIKSGFDQYRLVLAERELLEKTLSGSVKMLTDILSMVSPVAFGRASRVHRIVQKVVSELNIKRYWNIEIAAMLSQIGCVTLPNEIVEKACQGRELTPTERNMFQSHSKIGSELIANIPRLEEVAEIVAYQEKDFSGQGTPIDSVKGSAIPIGARILHAVLKYDMLVSSGKSSRQAIAAMKSQSVFYDPSVLKALSNVVNKEIPREIRNITLVELEDGMILADDIITSKDLLLVNKGVEISISHIIRLKNFAKTNRIIEPFRVLVPMKEH